MGKTESQTRFRGDGHAHDLLRLLAAVRERRAPSTRAAPTRRRDSPTTTTTTMRTVRESRTTRRDNRRTSQLLSVGTHVHGRERGAEGRGGARVRTARRGLRREQAESLRFSLDLGSVSRHVLNIAQRDGSRAFLRDWPRVTPSCEEGALRELGELSGTGHVSSARGRRQVAGRRRCPRLGQPRTNLEFQPCILRGRVRRSRMSTRLRARTMGTGLRLWQRRGVLRRRDGGAVGPKPRFFSSFPLFPFSPKRERERERSL